MRRILILEDQEDTRNALVQTVKKVNSQTVVFAVGFVKDAYDIAMDYTIDLFILDIILKPGDKYRDCSGADFAQNMRTIKKYKFTPIIFITGLYDEKLNMYSHIRCYRFIEKPFDFAEVEEVIREALSYHTRSEMDRQIFYRNQGILEALTIKDIIYVKTAGQNLQAVTVKETRIIPYRSLQVIRKELDSEMFLKINRTTVVNAKFIRAIDSANRYVYLDYCEDVLEIGPVMKKSFMEKIRVLQHGYD